MKKLLRWAHRPDAEVTHFLLPNSLEYVAPRARAACAGDRRPTLFFDTATGELAGYILFDFDRQEPVWWQSDNHILMEQRS